MKTLRWLCRVMLGIARRPGRRNNLLLDGDDQDDVERLEQLRRDIDLYLKRAGYGNNALKHAFAVQVDITAMLVETKIATRQALSHAVYVADQVSRPTAAIEDQLARAFKVLAWAQRLRFSAFTAFLFATATIIAGSILAWILVESKLETPDTTAFRVAAGNFTAGWTALIAQNDLQAMVAICTKPANIIPAPNGRHHCYVPLWMDGVEAKPLAMPAWSQDAAGVAAR